MLPEEVQNILCKHNNAGYEAYAVGGCMRDFFMGKTPQDYDLTTSALPEQVMELFKAFPTGLQHGTVTVRENHQSFEVTTFRKDGNYKDHRRPEEVTFTTSIEEDLQRRDFTMNAIAMDAKGNVVDPFGGREDIQKKCIRCVGNPDERFGEDALRIMRALRFASKTGFQIEEKTKESIFARKEDLHEIAVERVQEELCKLLLGDYAVEVLMEYGEVIGTIIPEIMSTINFDQHSTWHNYTLYDHICHTVGNVEKDPVLRYTMLLHDLGKPACFTMDEEGKGDFYGHGVKSAEIARNVTNHLRMDKRSSDRIVTLVEHHDREVPETKKGIIKALNQFGEETFCQLLKVKRADSLAQSEKAKKTIDKIDACEKLLNEVMAEKPCYSLATLAVDGRDIMALGYQDKEIGTILNHLLQQVMDGELENEKVVLLETLTCSPT